MERRPRISKVEREIKYRPKGPNMALVDGLNAVFKVIFTLGTLTYKGQNTTIQYGIINILKAAIESNWPRGVIFTLDGKGGKKKRLEIYPEYKENRKDKNRDLDWDAIFEEVRNLKVILPLFGVGVAEVEGMEADDTIASICKYLNDKDKSVAILSSDKDMYQLVNSYNYIYSISNRTKLTADNFFETVGVPQDRYLDYRCLVGDSSDGIKGIAGIGDKTASSLLNDMSLDEALRTPMSGRLAALSRPESVDIINRNRLLMDLSCPLDYRDYSNVVVLPDRINKEEVKDTLHDLGFFSFLDKFDEFIIPFATLQTRKEMD